MPLVHAVAPESQSRKPPRRNLACAHMAGRGASLPQPVDVMPAACSAPRNTEGRRCKSGHRHEADPALVARRDRQSQHICGCRPATGLDHGRDREGGPLRPDRNTPSLPAHSRWWPTLSGRVKVSTRSIKRQCSRSFGGDPRRHDPSDWDALAEATAVLLDAIGKERLAEVARSAETTQVLEAWKVDETTGVAAFKSAQSASGVEPPDTDVLAWSTILGPFEADALEAVERVLGEAVASGELVPGGPPGSATARRITERVLTIPMDLPPGQTYVGLVTTERVSRSIELARHPVLSEWRASVANRLLSAVAVEDPDSAVAPFWWLLQLCAGPTVRRYRQSGYLLRPMSPMRPSASGGGTGRSLHALRPTFHQLTTIREVVRRLRLVRRRGRRLVATAHGRQLLRPSGRTLVDRGCRDGAGRGLPARRDRSGRPTAPAGTGGGAPVGGRRSPCPGRPGVVVWGNIRSRSTRWRRPSTSPSGGGSSSASWRRRSPDGTERPGARSIHTPTACGQDGESMVLGFLRARAIRPRHSILD